MLNSPCPLLGPETCAVCDCSQMGCGWVAHSGEREQRYCKRRDNTEDLTSTMGKAGGEEMVTEP